MTGLENGIEFGEVDGPVGAFGRAPMMRLVWFVGLLSTIYLVGNAVLLSLLSIAFMDYSTPDFEWSKVAEVGRDSLPLFCFALIGSAGLKLWPQGRFRLLGLTAIVVQTALAVCAYANPEGFLIFSDWLG